MKCYYCGENIEEGDTVVTYIVSCCGIGYVHKRCEPYMDEYSGYVVKKDELRAEEILRKDHSGV